MMQPAELFWTLAHRKEIVERLEETRAGSTLTGSDVWDDILDGRRQLWVDVEDGGDLRTLIVTEIAKRRRETVFRITNVWSNRLDTDYILFFEDHARSLGLPALEAEGRNGWERVSRRYGYKRQWVVLRKEL